MNAPNPEHKSSISCENTPSGHYFALLKGLEKTERLAPDKLLDHQFRLLRPLINHAYQHVPYYRQAFKDHGLTPERISAENWHRVPILTRETLQKHEFLSPYIPPHHGRVFKKQSSGSTGQPVTVFNTDYTQRFFDLLTLRDCQWQRWDVRGTFASIRNFPHKNIPEDGVFLRSWGEPFETMSHTGSSMLLSIRTPVHKQLQWLLAHQPNYLQTYPSNLMALIEESFRMGIIIPNLLQVRTTSETVSNELRELCQGKWGVPLTASYSSEELGYMAIQCPDSECYHVQAESVFLEVLNNQNAPCHTGEIGRIVVTSLFNYATPLIRYEIQDYAEVGGACPCGRGLPVLKRIVGRHRNMLTNPCGEKSWPTVSSATYREIAPINQYQFIQHDREHIEMLLVSERELLPCEKENLLSHLHKSFGYPFVINFSRLETIPRAENGKYEEFISRITD